MSSWNLLGKGYEKIPLLASANLWGDYHSGALPSISSSPAGAALRCRSTSSTRPTAPAGH
ncbi:hypothetical protein FLG15_23155 (plasmid) [Xanthomonas phaseoli pv. dieffenbachiae]